MPNSEIKLDHRYVHIGKKQVYININMCVCVYIYIYTHTDTHAICGHFSHVQLFVTLRTIARQAPLSIGFSGQEHWNGLPALLHKYSHHLWFQASPGGFLGMYPLWMGGTIVFQCT